MYEETMKELNSSGYDLVIATAAPADYAPVSRQNKIETHSSPHISLDLQATPKIIDNIRKISPHIFLVAFRAQAGLSYEDLISDGYERLSRAKADIIAVNDVGRHDIGFNSDFNELTLIDLDRNIIALKRAPKPVIARQLLDEVSRRLSIQTGQS
jgi:phosphopantothenoylcysteine decarboxylase/phosphopantothenate--cysteine ligase